MAATDALAPTMEDDRAVPEAPAIPMRFADRADAGRQLAERLRHLRNERPVVLALPRGGVLVAFEVADALDAPMDVLVVRKLGAPAQPELGIGAVAEDGTVVVDAATIRALGINEEELAAIEAAERREIRRRMTLYRNGRPLPRLEDRTVIVVDDGVATAGADIAALDAVRRRRPRRLVFAVPVCAPTVAEGLAEDADELVVLLSPHYLDGVGRWFRDFSQVPDDEVVALLNRAASR